MTRRNGLPTLSDAIAWLSAEFAARETPARLHQREHDGWGLMFAPAFARRLDAKPEDQVHEHAPPYRRDACPWRYGMWRALTLLRKRSEPSYDVVLTLVINSYSVGDMGTLGIGPGVILTSIRRLFDCYERAPQTVGWVSKSEAQQVAEGAVA